MRVIVVRRRFKEYNELIGVYSTEENATKAVNQSKNIDKKDKIDEIFYSREVCYVDE